MITFTLRRQLSVCTLTFLWLIAGASFAPAQEQGELNLAHIPEEAFAAVVIRPQKLLADPSLKLMPIEVIKAGGKQALGVNLLDVESAIGFMMPPAPGTPPDWGIVLHFSKPQSLAGTVLDATIPSSVNKIEYFAGRNPSDPSFCLYQEKTLLISPEPMLKSMLVLMPGESQLRTLLAAAKTDADVTAIAAIEPVRPMLKQALVMLPPLPPPAQPLLTIPDYLDSLQIDLNMVSGRPSGITLTGKDAAAAQEIEKILTGALEFGKQLFIAQTQQSTPQQDNPVQNAELRYAKRLANAFVAKLTPVREGKDVLIAVDASPAMATSSVLVALLLPAVQQAREAARRTHSRNNLKQIGLGMHNYHDVFQKFPAQASFEKKKPLLSWRVHLLPYLDVGVNAGGNDLYKEFHLDEPWDSPHNKKLIERMPAVYQNPNRDNRDFKTNYLVVSGENTMFPGEEAVAIRQVTDGTSNTIMVVEADEAVIWTKPQDWESDAEQPMKGLGGLRSGGFFGLRADGSVRFHSVHIDPGLIRALLTPAGGEVVPNGF